MQVKTSIDISASIDRVFEVFSDIEKAENRIEGIKKIEILEGTNPMHVGFKWKETRLMFGKEATETMWVTELNPSKNYVVEAESHGTKYRTEYVFTEEGGATHVELLFEGTPVTLGAKILGVVFSSMTKTMKNMLHKDMEDLKKVCEQN